MTRPKKPNQARIRKNGAIDWVQQLRFDVEYAKRILLTSGEVRPMFVMHTREGVKVFAMTAPNEEARLAIFKLLALTCIAENAEGLTFISEAWMRKLPQLAGETPAEARRRAKQGPMPSQAEDRIEIVIVQTAYRDPETGERRVLCDAREILRGADGKPSGVKESQGEQPDSLEGRIVNIFPVEPPGEAARSLARTVLAEFSKRFDLHQVDVSGGHA
jgi:hypothetical protein